ncbi:MAG: ADP-glyceromanno-heptose 6-epimerase [Puniceicoccales bacterium]|jgi:ADP-L-glycero-D-manno-heptose 6-epimerase|nr:ADP-glyceromanno-heptose 6-epimerase [Puniceicoccales bacterium]
MKLSQDGTILVTGGAGFIGSALICELNRRGFDNILVADFMGDDGKFRNLVPLRFMDYVEADTLLRLVERNDALVGDIGHIFHLGACASTAECDMSYLIGNNYEYGKKLANFAESRGIRFLYASSAATYGDGSRGMSDAQNFHRLRPLNAYGYSKYLFDQYAARNNLHAYGMKYFNVFGPNEYHKRDMRSMVLKSYESIRENGKIYLFKSHRAEYADGEQMRDFLYVKDAVAMTIFLSEIPDVIDGISTHGLYNIGSSAASTWKELAQSIFDAMGMEMSVEFVDMPHDLRDRYQYHTRADISKLRAVGYSGEITPLKDAVSDYVTNYLACGMKVMDPD